MGNRIRVVKLETSRDAYSIGEVVGRFCMTARELINWLENNADDDAPVIFSNDNGYTYGKLTDDSISINTETIED